MNPVQIYILAVAVWLGMWSVAWGHDWYPRACCSEQDCFPVDPSEIEWTLDGIRIKATGEIIPHDKVRRDAPDGQIHRCTLLGRPGGRTLSTGEGPCFWMPEAGL